MSRQKKPFFIYKTLGLETPKNKQKTQKMAKTVKKRAKNRKQTYII
jgi:hypothetical protein